MSELSNETTFMQKKSFLTILEPQTCFWIFAIFGQNLELFFKQRFCKRLNFFFFSEFENRTSQLLPVFSLVKKYLKLAAVRPKEDRSQNRPILGHFRTNSTFSNRQVTQVCVSTWRNRYTQISGKIKEMFLQKKKKNVFSLFLMWKHMSEFLEYKPPW